MDMLSTVLRRAGRVAAVALGVGLLALAAPAEARPPSTWEQPDNGSTLGLLLLLVGVPVLVFVVLTILVYLPSMIRGTSSEPAIAFQERSEWFGGPRKGVDAAPDAPAEDTAGKGGASARW
jgi:hypothetical protein